MIKQKIVDGLNETLDETFEITDIFHNADPRSGKLRFCGYRNLSKYYDFREVEFKFSGRAIDYIALQKLINGLYYVTSTKDKGVLRIFSTDHRLVNRIKLYGSDFEKIANSYKS